MMYPQLTHKQSERNAVMRNARSIIHFLSVTLGERTLRRYENLTRSTDFIADRFSEHGYVPRFEDYTVDKKRVCNIIAEIPGLIAPERIIVIGAHYDTIEGTPGADDNASGIAGLMELYRLLSPHRFRRTLRFIAFTLEEPPYFQTDRMGSMVNARNSKRRKDPIDFMICLEMLGFAHRRYAQHVPFYDMERYFPKKGNFLAVASLPSSAEYTRLWKRVYGKYSPKELVEIIGPPSIPGITHSDHYSFNRHGYPAIMLTDTAFYRNTNYHSDGDTIDTINFSFLARHILHSFHTIKEIADIETLKEG